MDLLKIITRRITMSILFVVALFTTFQSVSGVEAQTFLDWINYNRLPHFISNYETEDNFVVDNYYRKVGLQFKSLNHFMSDATEISSSIAVNTPVKLEDAIDWSKYPKRMVTATGYTAGVESTGKSPSNPQYGITYSGVRVKRDLYSTIAADLNVFPIGTILFIPGYGYGVVADKGGAIRGNKIDLYYKTVRDVYNQWGKKELNVYVVRQGNGHLTEKDLVALNEDKSMQAFRQQYINPKSVE